MAVDGLRQTLSDRYTIERELGRGGMATVFLATDEKVSRQVAIKVLHPELAAALGGERFHREIQIATHLTHPNILPVYDSGEAEGTLYYVMPFVEGESLRNRLDRERQLGIDDAIRITCQIASALEYAHRTNIVHRDIKPENILIEAGQAVLADFGIARAVTSAADTEALTRTGMSLGTPAYMSPEQAMGERTLDGRSDQYALACVTYEMLAGQPPFTAPTMQALIARHIAEQVPLITTVRASVPDEVQDVILQALEKVPADRFPTIGQFADALADAASMTMTATSRRATPPRSMRTTTRTNRVAARQPVGWSRKKQLLVAAAGVLVLGGSAAAGVWAWDRPTRLSSTGSLADGLDPRRVAVLYFDDLSRDRSLAHAADGLTEGLIDELSRVRALKVVSRNGVAPYRGVDLSRDSIAQVLQAGSLIEGSIEPVGSRMRVAVRLIDGNSGVDVQRASFELQPSLLVAGLDSLVQEVARLLGRRLGDEIRLQQRRASTSSSDAWTLVQRAERLRKDANTSSTAGDADGAVRALARADSILVLAAVADPKWVEPIIERGSLALRRAERETPLGAIPWLEAASRHAEQALQRAPGNAEALALRGTSRFLLWTRRVNPDPAALDTLLQRARRDLEAARDADPSLARAYIALSYVYYQIDDVPGALLAARRAYEEDAYLADADRTLERLFLGSLDLEQFAEARRWCAEGARRFPRHYRFVQCQLWLMATPAVQAEPERARKLLATLDTVIPAPLRGYTLTESRMLFAGALARAGLVDSARSVMRATRTQITHDVDPEQELLAREAYVRTLTRDYDAAIDLLKRYVVANPGHGFAEQAGTVWWWRELRSHPRWREITQPGR
jgi:serine/threonine-protein kinase